MKYFKIIIVIAFFLILILPISFINLKTNQFSEIDNSELPEWSSVDGVENFEKFISNRIGFRNSIIRIYTLLNDKLFHKMIHPTYTYGKDNYVFFKTNAEKHDNSYLDAFANLVKNMQTYTKERGSYFLFVINPTKISIYKQYLPEGYHFNDYRISYLKKKFKELGVNYIDNTQTLMNASQNEQVFNKQYDAGHWNDIGAFYGINKIYEKMAEDGIDIKQLNKDDFDISYEHKTSLPSSEFYIEEDVPLYTLKNQKYIGQNTFGSSLMISSKHKSYTETYQPENKYNLLFFRGSYLIGREKFLAEQFKHSYFIHNYYNSINFDYYYNIMHPDIVLFEGVEYAIDETYYSRKQIMQKKYNKVYSKYKDLPSGNFTTINTDKMRQTIMNNIEKGTMLTDISLNNENIKYAYLKVDEDVYDFSIFDNYHKATLQTEKLRNKNISIIVIDEELKTQQIFEIVKK